MSNKNLSINLLDTGKFEPIEDTNKCKKHCCELLLLLCRVFFSSFLASRVGRKRGKMNLEKTINKNMFDVSTAIRDSNPLQQSELVKTDSLESSSSAPISSILSHPKQKLTAQFKRAITMIKQRSEPTHQSSPPKLTQSISLIEKPDATLLTSLIEEPIHHELPCQSFVHIKPSNQENNLNSATIITLDPITQLNQQNQNQSVRIIKSTNQQIIIPQSSSSSSSSATLSPTPPSSSTTTTTGELTILVTNL